MSKEEEHQQPNNKETDLFVCSICHQSLARGFFPKKKFAKHGETTPVCRACRKAATAKRCKQPVAKPVLQGRQSEAGERRKPNNFGYCNYVDRLFAMDCFQDIVNLKVFASAKDVSESMAALLAVSRHGNIMSEKTSSQSDGDYNKVLCLCIGDGCTPRTAVLASYLQKGWTCISIDPNLSDEWKGNELPVDGLIGYQGTLEQFVTDNDTSQTLTDDHHVWDHLVLLCVHSHARFQGDASIHRIRESYGNVPSTLVSLPCCPKFRHVSDIGRPPNHRFDDDCVFSACRTVDVWNFSPSSDACLPCL